MGLGLLLGAIRYAWPRASPASFYDASKFVASYEPYFSRHPMGLDGLGIYLWFVSGFCFFCGVFIFFRRGVWWWQDREDERTITQLRLQDPRDMPRDVNREETNVPPNPYLK